MIGRRATITLALGGIAAHTVLPPRARAEPDPWVARNDFERRFLVMFRQLTDAQQESLLRGMKRYLAGMSLRDAMRGVYAEAGLTPPADLLALAV